MTPLTTYLDEVESNFERLHVRAQIKHPSECKVSDSRTDGDKIIVDSDEAGGCPQQVVWLGWSEEEEEEEDGWGEVHVQIIRLLKCVKLYTISILPCNRCGTSPIDDRPETLVVMTWCWRKVQISFPPRRPHSPSNVQYATVHSQIIRLLDVPTLVGPSGAIGDDDGTIEGSVDGSVRESTVVGDDGGDGNEDEDEDEDEDERANFFPVEGEQGHIHSRAHSLHVHAFSCSRLFVLCSCRSF